MTGMIDIGRGALAARWVAASTSSSAVVTWPAHRLTSGRQGQHMQQQQQRQHHHHHSYSYPNRHSTLISHPTNNHRSLAYTPALPAVHSIRLITTKPPNDDEIGDIRLSQRAERHKPQKHDEATPAVIEVPPTPVGQHQMTNNAAAMDDANGVNKSSNADSSSAASSDPSPISSPSSTTQPHDNASTSTVASPSASSATDDTAADNSSFTPIPTTEPSDALELEVDPAESSTANKDPSAQIPKLEGKDDVIRGTLWFDNMYPIRIHWMDLRYLVAIHNHDEVIPRLFAKAFGKGSFRLISAIPRATEGGVFVMFEVRRSDTIRTASDVTKSLILLLKAKPVRARLTPKAVRCHLVRGSPFLDNMASRFPYNRLRIELRGPSTSLNDITVEQLWNEFSPFGRIFDLTLQPYEKDKPRIGFVQFVRMYSAVGARNCLHRLRLTVPLTVSSMPAQKPATPSTESSSSKQGQSSNDADTVPKADALMFLSYESILKTSVLKDFFVKHPRIMVPLLGLLFAAFTYLIFDPLREFNIESTITQRFALNELSASLPWPLSWLRARASDLGNSRVFRMLYGMETDSQPTVKQSWSAREADEEKVKKWLHSTPERILFITGPKGAGKQALVRKLVSDRKNVVFIDVSHMLERSDDDFIRSFATTLGFKPEFALLTWLSSILDIFTPGAGKASGSSTATSVQILKILECTSHALMSIARKENHRRQKLMAKRMAETRDRQRRQQIEQEAAQNWPKDVEHHKIDAATSTLSATAVQADKGRQQEAAERQKKSESSPQPDPTTNAAAQAVTGVARIATGLPAMEGATPGSAAPAAAAQTGTGAATGTSTVHSQQPTAPGSVATSAPSPGQLPIIPPESGGEVRESTPLRVKDDASTDKSKPSSPSSSESSNSCAMPASSPSHSASVSPSDVLSDNLPLFVIDGFNLENSHRHGNFLNVLVAWCSEMSGDGCGRFVFLSDQQLEEQICKQLPDAKISEIMLSDASPEAAKQFLFNSMPQHMRQAVPDSQTLQALNILGGRYSDLMALVRGVENGNQPVEVVDEIVLQSMNTVKSMLLNEELAKEGKWSKVQLWQVLTMITSSPSGTVLYDDVLFNVFSGDEFPLKSLVRHDLLRVEPGLGRGGDLVKAGSPVFLESFRRLMTTQSKLKPGMDLLVVKYQTQQEQTKIHAAEEELNKIARLLTAQHIIDTEQEGSMLIAGGWAGRRALSIDRLERDELATSSSHPSSSPSFSASLQSRANFLLRLLNDSHKKMSALDEKRRQCEKEIKAIKRIE